MDLPVIDELSLPVDYRKLPRWCPKLCNDLRRFPLLDELDDASKDCPFDMFGKLIIWLARMLCRSTTDLNAA